MSGRLSKDLKQTGPCSACGKRGYYSKADAKRARTQIHAGDSRLRPYRCDAADSEIWHLGHIGDHVTQGVVSRAQAYDKPKLYRDPYVARLEAIKRGEGAA